MSRFLLDFPDEILLEILKQVMFSDLPVHLSFLIDTKEQEVAARLRQRAYPRPWYPRGHSTSVLNYWVTCNACSLHAERQMEHLRDWVIATDSSRRFRALAMEAFLSEKSFVLATPSQAT